MIFSPSNETQNYRKEKTVDNATSTAISAAVGAVVAVGTIVAVDQYKKLRGIDKAEAQAAAEASTEENRRWYMQGYYEGRENLLKHWATEAKPTDFVDR
jgi:hypothetical protein